MYRQHIRNWLAEAGPNKETIATPFICLQYFFIKYQKSLKQLIQIKISKF